CLLHFSVRLPRGNWPQKPFRPVKLPVRRNTALDLVSNANAGRDVHVVNSLSSQLRRNRGLEMEFGIFSNGFRPHTTAAQTYEEDLAEIIHADKLGFRYAYISEHHGEPVYIDKVDTLPVPELLMCKAAALTKQIRMGAAVKLIHLAHPVDAA